MKQKKDFDGDYDFEADYWQNVEGLVYGVCGFCVGVAVTLFFVASRMCQ